MKVEANERKEKKWLRAERMVSSDWKKMGNGVERVCLVPLFISTVFCYGSDFIILFITVNFPQNLTVPMWVVWLG